MDKETLVSFLRACDTLKEYEGMWRRLSGIPATKHSVQVVISLAKIYTISIYRSKHMEPFTYAFYLCKQIGLIK